MNPSQNNSSQPQQTPMSPSAAQSMQPQTPNLNPPSPSQPAETEAVQPTSPQQPNTAMAPNLSPPPPASNNKKLFLLAGAVVLILILVLGAFLVYSRMKSINGSKFDLGTLSGTKSVSSIFSSKDTDGDLLPDDMEAKLGFDANLAEFERCIAGSDCNESKIDSAKTTPHNVMIILDASGSMSLASGSQTKMEAAKAAIKDYLSVADSNANINVGLAVYGHKGSNSTADKSTSCANAEVVAGIGQFNSTNADTYLAAIHPTGWTNIGLAINRVANAFVDKQGQQNEIIVLTDGEETCATDPVGAATSIHQGPAQVTVNVIGFATSATESNSLKAIADAGGGNFSAASTYNDLQNLMSKKLLENLRGFQSEVQCETDALNDIYQCITDTKKKVIQYVSTLKGKEWSAAANIQNDFFKNIQAKYDAYAGKIYKANKEKSKQIVN